METDSYLDGGYKFLYNFVYTLKQKSHQWSWGGYSAQSQPSPPKIKTNQYTPRKKWWDYLHMDWHLT